MVEAATCRYYLVKAPKHNYCKYYKQGKLYCQNTNGSNFCGHGVAQLCVLVSHSLLVQKPMAGKSVPQSDTSCDHCTIQ